MTLSLCRSCADTRSGLYPRELPFVVGCEGGGEVVAVGEEALFADPAAPKAGDHVAYYSPGSYAQFTAVPAARAAVVPPRLSVQAAVALTVQGWTAHYLTHSTVSLSPMHDIVVTAAAGGTGKLLVQMAKQAGARVLGLVSSNEKAAIASRNGCDDTFLYRDDTGTRNFSSVAREWSRDGAGVHFVYDSVGAATASQSLASLQVRGGCVFYGNASGAPHPIAPLSLATAGSLWITRPLLDHYLLTAAETQIRADEVYGLAASGALSWDLEGVLPLAQAADAHVLLESGQTTGKILLDIP